jgi:prepilin-type N-terminal cleavage/methylation domain-containing protein
MMGNKIKIKRQAFTIIEIIIVVSVLSILAVIGLMTYRSVTISVRSATVQSDIQNVQEMIETYRARNHEYPKTTDESQANWRTVDVRTDDGCFNGTSQPDWVPSLDEELPQSSNSTNTGVDGRGGCYLYASDGVNYVISAWNMLKAPQTEKMYRRLGFREFQTDTSTQFYTCNANVVGGANGGYDINEDYYKHSYTISNITDCDETPPPGA